MSAGTLEPLLEEAREGKGSRMGRFSRFEIALDILAENIGFQVYTIAGLAVGKGGVPVGVRNDGDFRDVGVAIPPRDREADAVDGDGAFGYDITPKVFGNCHGKPPVFAFRSFRVEMPHAASAVDVSLDKVAAKFFAGRERLLEIDP